MTKKTNSGLKIICLNRKASFNYFFEDLIEAGIVLKGSEIKSIREGKVNIADSYAVGEVGETTLNVLVAVLVLPSQLVTRSEAV